MRRLAIALAGSIVSLAGASAQEDYESWPLLQNPFELTGGGGIMIGGYEPVVAGARCVTDFTATEPNGAVHHNMVAFDASRRRAASCAPTAPGAPATGPCRGRHRSGSSSRTASRGARLEEVRWRSVQRRD